MKNRKSNNRRQLREKSAKLIKIINILVAGTTQHEDYEKMAIGIIKSNNRLQEIHKLLIK